jgi:hypothetical protein
MTRIGLTALAGVLFLSLPSGCDGRGPIPEVYDTLGGQTREAHLLYVEEVIFPEVIYEDESSEMLWRVSAEANPDVLRGLHRGRKIPIIYTIPFGEPQDTYLFDAYITGDGDPGAEVDDALPVLLPAYPVGEWSIIVRSAARRSLGGTTYLYQFAPAPGPRTPLEDLQETRYTFAVIPRPQE